MKLDRKTWLLVAGSAVCILLALGLGMAYISVTYRAPAGEEQPKVTDWMQAWGSILGVFAGLIAGGAAAALLMFERRQAQLARAELEAQRAEADLITPRAVLAADPAIYMHDEHHAESLEVTVTNYGPSPIRRVTPMITLADGVASVMPQAASFIPPGGQRSFRHRFHQPVRLPLPDGFSRAMGFGNQDARDTFTRAARVVLYFYDSAGQGWRTTKDGQIEKWSEPFPSPPLNSH